MKPRASVWIGCRSFSRFRGMPAAGSEGSDRGSERWRRGIELGGLAEAQDRAEAVVTQASGDARGRVRSDARDVRLGVRVQLQTWPAPGRQHVGTEKPVQCPAKGGDGRRRSNSNFVDLVSRSARRRAGSAAFPGDCRRVCDAAAVRFSRLRAAARGRPDACSGDALGRRGLPRGGRGRAAAEARLLSIDWSIRSPRPLRRLACAAVHRVDSAASSTGADLHGRAAGTARLLRAADHYRLLAQAVRRSQSARCVYAQPI